MDTIFVIREYVQRIYAKNSKIYEKVIQFLLAFIVFFVINQKFGFMKILASPVVSLGLSVICAFLPLTVTMLAGTALVLIHIFTFSPMLFALTAAVFLIMYAFYFRLTPKMAVVVLLTPIAFALKIPYVIPVAFGLMTTPVCLVAIICGTMVFYMLSYLKKAAVVVQGAGLENAIGQSADYLKQVFQNKEMWVMIAALSISFLVVYTLRKQAIDHAWKIGAAGGVVAGIVATAVGDIALGIHVSYGMMIFAGLLAVLLGLGLELFFFAVDYTRSETLEFEDDEYHYYVKAVPKISLSSSEKEVKKIHERQEAADIPGEDGVSNATEEEIDKALIEESLKRELGMKG